MYVLADKMGKYDLARKKDTKIINRKAFVLDKFKTYGNIKEKKRMELASVGTNKVTAQDPLKSDKLFLKKLVAEFKPTELPKSR